MTDAVSPFAPIAAPSARAAPGQASTPHARHWGSSLWGDPRTCAPFDSPRASAIVEIVFPEFSFPSRGVTEPSKTKPS